MFKNIILSIFTVLKYYQHIFVLSIFFLALFSLLLYNIVRLMKNILLFLSVLSGVCAVSCSNNSSWAEYQKLKETSQTGRQLLNSLIDFEIAHAQNFEAKVDLASYYAAEGNMQKTEEYLKRAESVLSHSHNSDEGKKIRCVYYGTWAYLYMVSADYEKALSYAERAVKTHKQSGKTYILLKAQILYAQGKNDEALSVFDKSAKDFPELFKPEDFRSYMYVLAQADKTEDALRYFERYLETGEYYQGLGLFGSGLCEKLQKTDESVLYAFTDYEFSRKTSDTDRQFLNNLSSLEQTLKTEAEYTNAVPVIDFVRSYFTPSIPYENYSGTDIFVADYILINNRLRDGISKDADLQNFIRMEVYFKRFPAYYWTLWRLFDFFGSGTQEYKTACLEKCIYLSPASVYADSARRELGIAAGLTQEQSRYLLLPAEVEYLITRYEQSNNRANITAVLDLLNLPDNTYVYTAVMLLHQYKNTGFVSDLQNRYPEKITPKVKERLQVIVKG